VLVVGDTIEPGRLGAQPAGFCELSSVEADGWGVWSRRTGRRQMPPRSIGNRTFVYLRYLQIFHPGHQLARQLMPGPLLRIHPVSDYHPFSTSFGREL